MSDVSSQRLMAHVETLARWTKHAGSEGELASLEYVRSVLDGYGYATELLVHPAYVSLPVAAEVQAGGSSLRALAHSFSASGTVTGELVYVGQGTAADYEAVDVAGRVVLIDGVAGAEQALEAARHGVLAQLHVSPHEHLHDMCVSPVWGSPDDRRAALLPAVPIVSIAAADGAPLRARCRAGQTPRVTVRADVDTGWRETPILIAELAAADEPFVLFSGHHDTWHHGVMDNGGANATMLEVARLVAERRDEWRRGLRIAFWSGHSQGRYSSSAWYADHHWEELEALAVAHVNVDSTGGCGNTVVSDTTAAAELGALAQEALATQTGQVFAGRRMQRAGDQSFWGIGLPAIFANMGEQPARAGVESAQAAVFGREPRRGNGTGWWWHTPADTLDKIDPELLTRDTRIYLHVVWRLLTDAVLPFDFGATAAAIAARLRELHGDALDLTLAIARAERLGTLVARLDGDPAWLNEQLRRLSRVLTPLDYCAGDRFGHDPATFVGGLPGLADVPRLASLAPGSAEHHFLRSRRVRERTRVEVGLRDAVALVEAALEQAERAVSA